MGPLSFPSLYGDSNVDALLAADNQLRYLLVGEPVPVGGGSPQTVNAQVATLSLTGVAGIPSGGPVAVTAQVATLTLTGISGTPSGGPVTQIAQVAELTLTGVPGSPTGGPVSITAQRAALVLTGVAGNPSIRVQGPRLRLNDAVIDRIRVGGSEVIAVYLGDVQVWPDQD